MFGGSCVAVTETQPEEHSRGDLVFLHGRIGCSSAWDPLIELLGRSYRCLVIDLPGFGRSYHLEDRGLSIPENASLVTEVLNRMTERRVVVVCHDTGAGLAQASASSCPDRIAGMVLANPAFLAEPLQRIPMGFWGIGLRLRLRRLFRETGEGFTIERKSLIRDTWLKGTDRWNLHRAVDLIQKSWPGPEERRVWQKELQSLPHPVLLLWGARDTLNSLDACLSLIQGLREVYFFEHEECGHWPCLEEPAWAAGRIREFLFHVMPGQGQPLVA